jgi:hypothetical protein
VKFEALVELSRAAEGIIPSSLLRKVPKACFGVHNRDLYLKINKLRSRKVWTDEKFSVGLLTFFRIPCKEAVTF